MFSFGICLTEMETRQMPYAELAQQQGMTKWKLLNKIAHEGIRPTMPPAGHKPGDMSVELRRLIDSCLDADPARRPSMEQALASLQAAVPSCSSSAAVKLSTVASKIIWVGGRPRGCPLPASLQLRNIHRRQYL